MIYSAFIYSLSAPRTYNRQAHMNTRTNAMKPKSSITTPQYYCTDIGMKKP